MAYDGLLCGAVAREFASLLPGSKIEKVMQPESDMLIIEVWDRNLFLLSRSTDRARSYFSENFTWSVVDIPDATVSGSFVISVYEFAGVFVGVDNSSLSQRSALTARIPNRILPWDLLNRSYNQTSWMIRALGHSPAPKVSLEIEKNTASQASPAEIRVMAADQDDNLLSAAMHPGTDAERAAIAMEMRDGALHIAEAGVPHQGSVAKDPKFVHIARQITTTTGHHHWRTRWQRQAKAARAM